MKTLLTALFALALAVPALAQDEKKKDVEPPKKEEPKKEPELMPPPVAMDEGGAPAPGRPAVEIVLIPGEASAVPFRKGVSYANGGIIDVAQPNPTTLVITMTGLVATNADLLCTSIANYQFDLSQDFQIVCNSKRVKAAKLTIDGRVVGILRTNHEHYAHCICKKGGIAETQPATAAITSCSHEAIVSLALPARSVCCEDDLSVYNHEGPFCVSLPCAKYTLHENWGIGTTHSCFHCRGASAEFSPQPQYCPEAGYSFQEFKPFNGTATKDFGYQVTIKITPEYEKEKEKEKEKE